MPALILHSRFRIAILMTTALALLATGCGWERTMTFPSPTGTNKIEIWQTRVDNSWGTRVELVSANRRNLLFENRREAHVYFVHVYWSPDEARVGIVATGANHWCVAGDIRTGGQIPFDLLRDDVAKSIRDTYHLQPDMDPIDWAAMVDAQTAFFKLHPDIRLTYR